jgi:hypothetical protein
MKSSTTIIITSVQVLGRDTVLEEQVVGRGTPLKESISVDSRQCDFRSSPKPGYGSGRASIGAGNTPQRIDKY